MVREGRAELDAASSPPASSVATDHWPGRSLLSSLSARIDGLLMALWLGERANKKWPGRGHLLLLLRPLLNKRRAHLSSGETGERPMATLRPMWMSI